MQDQGGIAFIECPNLLCDRVVAYVPDLEDPFSRVLCGKCHAEVEFLNPFFTPYEKDYEMEE